MRTALLALALAAPARGDAVVARDPIAGYTPQTNVVPHSEIDLDMAEIGAAAGLADFAQAMFVYENGGGGKCTQAAIDAATSTDPCFEKTTDDAAGNSVKGSGAIRTLKGFATSGEAKMLSEKWYPIFKAYWGGDANYADTFLQTAFADATMPDAMKAELIKKGASFQANWMYVLHEFEDAISDCIAGTLGDNDLTPDGDAPHAWDEGWAFYAGSLEGDGSTVGVSGKMLFNLAQKRCADFGTCATGTDSSTMAKANSKALEYTNLGRDKLLAGECNAVNNEFQLIVNQMTVPLIQGMLKYAFKADPANEQGSCGAADRRRLAGEGSDCPKEWGEGWAFAAAALPRIHYCSASVAQAIRDNLDVANAAPMKDGFAYVKQMVERTYDCLGITCADVGAFQNLAGVYEGMEACVDWYDPIAGYAPASNVQPHSKIDLDQKEINSAVSAQDYDQAMFVYENGGGGKCTQAAIDAAGSKDPCFEATTESAAGNSVKGSGSIRTLQGFATSGAAKMASEIWWPVYSAYWGDQNYADTFVQNAYGDADMVPLMKGELIKKGIAYQANWMYVLHEFEDAYADCKAGDIWDNDASNAAGAAPHAWDEGWAFYAGSLEGDGSAYGTSGAQLYNLAQKRCADFGTCEGGTDSTTIAAANKKALAAAVAGKEAILNLQCELAYDFFPLIVSQMTVPLLQGLLKYAFKSDPANAQGSCGDGDCPKEWAEGWAFAAAALPQIDLCDATVAATVRANLDVAQEAPMADGFAAVKAQLETTYDCLGVTCADVGAFQNSAGVYAGMAACTGDELVTVTEIEEETKRKNDKQYGVPLAAVAAVGVVVFVLAVVFYVKWKKTEERLLELVEGSKDSTAII